MGKVYIYGAGKVGRQIAKALAADKISIEAFVVTDLKDNASMVDGIPIICINDVVVTNEDSIIIGVSQKYRDEVHAIIKSRGVSGDVFDDCIFLIKKVRKPVLMALMDDCCQEDDTCWDERYYVGIKQMDHWGNVCHFTAHVDAEVCNLKGKINLLDMFEKVYGPYRNVNSLPVSECKKMPKVKLLMACCHKDKMTDHHISEEYIVPIQVGKCLTDKKICELADDTGINISAKNGNYCECTALYWAWKNKWGADLDYIGLCHYRRKLDILENALQSLKFNGIDIVLASPVFEPNIKKHFDWSTKNTGAWDIMKEVVYKTYSDYADAFELFEKQHMICPCNISIMRRGIFDEYCKFLFGVLEHVENYYEKKASRDDRYLGYLAEELTSVFALKHKDEYKIAYGDILVIR